MLIDPIVEDIHRRREEYMERFGYDLDAVVRDIKSREASSTPLLAPPASNDRAAASASKA